MENTVRGKDNLHYYATLRAYGKLMAATGEVVGVDNRNFRHRDNERDRGWEQIAAV